MSIPLLFALQQLVVGGDLDVQGHLVVHQLLVFTDLSSQILPGPPQGLLKLDDVSSSLVQVDVAFCPHLIDFLQQGVFLRVRDQKDSWMSKMGTNKPELWVCLYV